MLDPTLPEKQRARRRLVGALALVAAAVIILPMVLDSHPKPVTDDISIDIPARPAAPLPKTSHNDATDGRRGRFASGYASRRSAGQSCSGVRTMQLRWPPETKPKRSKPARNQALDQIGTESAGQAPRRSQAEHAATATQPDAKPAADSRACTTPHHREPTPDPNTPASPAGSRFVVQLGTFDEDAAAQGWVTKLKAAGVPAYIEHRKQADGTTRTLLRAGPFADRAAASAAMVKVRQAGLGGGRAPITRRRTKRAMFTSFDYAVMAVIGLSASARHVARPFGRGIRPDRLDRGVFYCVALCRLGRAVHSGALAGRRADPVADCVLAGGRRRAAGVECAERVADARDRSRPACAALTARLDCVRPRERGHSGSDPGRPCGLDRTATTRFLAQRVVSALRPNRRARNETAASRYARRLRPPPDDQANVKCAKQLAGYPRNRDGRRCRCDLPHVPPCAASFGTGPPLDPFRLFEGHAMCGIVGVVSQSPSIS